MEAKFNRKYSLAVQTNTINPQTGTRDTITIQNPFTIEFDVVRNVLSSSNTCVLRIYNLSQVNRNLLRKNVYDYGVNRTCVFRAGYDTNFPIAFAGSVMQCFSVREGNNFITQIECLDGGFAFVNGQTNASFPSGTPFVTVLENLAKTLPGVSLGAIGSYPGSLSRGNAYCGSTADLLTELTGGGFFIDNGKVNMLNDSECLAGRIFTVSSASGLLGTPLLENNIIHFEMLFEPQLQVGQQIQLDSITGQNFNGFYKVISVKHRGMISEAVCGDAITTVSMFAPEALKSVGQANVS